MTSYVDPSGENRAARRPAPVRAPPWLRVMLALAAVAAFAAIRPVASFAARWLAMQVDVPEAGWGLAWSVLRLMVLALPSLLLAAAAASVWGAATARLRMPSWALFVLIVDLGVLVALRQLALMLD